MKYSKLLILPLLLLTTILLLNFPSNNTSTSPSAIQKQVARKILRFHVIGNSNSTYDQSLKLKIRDTIINKFSETINKATNINDAQLIVKNNLVNINNTALHVLDKYNAPYLSTTKLCSRFFPTKKYGDLILPEGEYNSVCIELGDASGENWWCVLYPSLCFIDDTYAVIPPSSKDKLRNTLTSTEYNHIISQPNTKIKFSTFISKLFS